MKTTILGILTIAGVLINAVVQIVKSQPLDVMALTAGLTAGWGLIHAADAKPAK
jgi:hypothetical protein